MAQTGYTPILIYSSSTAAAAPVAGNLTNSTLGSELAINITDGKLFYKDNANAVQVIAWKNVPISTLSGAGTGVLTALGVNVGTAGSFVVNGGALGTPSSGTVTNLTGTASININGTVGATTPAAGTFTSLSDSGNLTFTGTGNRITGDFSNATTANRVLFQTSTANTNTTFGIMPNGTGTNANFGSYGNALDLANTSVLFMGVTNSGAEARFNSAIAGTGTYLPMTFYTGGSEAMRIFTSRGVSIGDTTDPGAGNLRLGTGNLVIGTSGKGIDFSATPGTGTSELLADYEEGTFTPSLVPGTSGSITLTTAQAKYTKVGRAVTVTGICEVASVSLPVGTLLLQGLPFTNSADASSRSAAAIYATGLAAGATTSIVGRIIPSESQIRIEKYAAGTASALAGDVQTNTLIQFCLTYFV
jgi:hypothetical protein